MTKKIMYIDMDGVIVDFPSAFPKIPNDILEQFKNDKDEIPNIFSKMEPMKDAIKSVEFLAEHFDIYILSTAPWENPSAWTDKLNWIKKHLPKVAYKRLILSHNKNLNRGDYLIDDRIANGAIHFKGARLEFGSKSLPNWESTIKHICELENLSYPKDVFNLKNKPNE